MRTSFTVHAIGLVLVSVLLIFERQSNVVFVCTDYEYKLEDM